MRDLSEVAEKIRAVREARRRFLNLWAMEQAVICPALDRMADDVESAGGVLRPITHFGFNDRATLDDDH